MSTNPSPGKGRRPDFSSPPPAALTIPPHLRDTVEEFVRGHQSYDLAQRGYCREKIDILTSMTDLAAYRQAVSNGDYLVLGQLSAREKSLATSPGVMALRTLGGVLWHHLPDLFAHREDAHRLAKVELDAAQEAWAALAGRINPRVGFKTDDDVRDYQQAGTRYEVAILNCLDVFGREVLEPLRRALSALDANTRPPEPTAAYCLLPGGRLVRWRNHPVEDEPIDVGALLWHLLQFLLDDPPRKTVPQGDVEEAVWGGKLIKSKTFANAISRLNRDLEQIRFPWKWHVKSGHVCRDCPPLPKKSPSRARDGRGTGLAKLALVPCLERPHMHTRQAPVPLPDTERIRDRLAVLAREQAILRRVLRVLVRAGYRPAGRPAGRVESDREGRDADAGG
jgi:hypothetical protein